MTPPTIAVPPTTPTPASIGSRTPAEMAKKNPIASSTRPTIRFSRTGEDSGRIGG
jgi:hypothetical protein